MKRLNRKTTPRVKHGRVQKKNHWEETPNYYNTYQKLPVIDRRRPGFGYRHLLRPRDILAFIELLPHWDELSRRLDAVVLAPGEPGRYGYYTPGVVHICAWPIELEEQYSPEFFDRDRKLLELVSVPCEPRGGYVRIHWTEWTARANQLLNVFLHELGHHYDALSTKRDGEPNRGEPFADWYARTYAKLIWDRYRDKFPDLPAT